MHVSMAAGPDIVSGSFDGVLPVAPGVDVDVVVCLGDVGGVAIYLFTSPDAHNTVPSCHFLQLPLNPFHDFLSLQLPLTYRLAPFIPFSYVSQSAGVMYSFYPCIGWLRL